MRCPHCRSATRTITSKQLSDLVREIYLDCMNVECLWRGVAQVGIVRTLVPSMTPAKGVSIPMVERRSNDIVVSHSTTVGNSVSAAAQNELRSPSFAKRMSLN
ncbi:ogr/Delta-like zinc finger family protein [Dyella sp. ASV21]|uniref:ogr/Delta-like zinc finger family protein n=1 Tax=Dyella sp. ASV21 TaxID=2795114 RepID=UPI001E3126DA|nr:ogr/Delta-like zinc finger family protein [Dyella sp. ASV21]